MSKIVMKSDVGSPCAHPAPVIGNVIIVNPITREEAYALPAIIDTAMDVSRIPKSVATKLGLQPTAGFLIDISKKDDFKSLDQKAQEAAIHRLYAVDFKLCSNEVKTGRAILGPDGYILLGRDILKDALLTLTWRLPASGMLDIPNTTGP
jgi:hypothetical protein